MRLILVALLFAISYAQTDDSSNERQLGSSEEGGLDSSVQSKTVISTGNMLYSHTTGEPEELWRNFGGSVKYEKIADCHVATEITNGQKFFTGISMENCAGKCLANDQCVYFGYGNPAGYKSDAGRISDGQKFGKCALGQSDIQLQDDSICRWSVYDPTSEISTENMRHMEQAHVTAEPVELWRNFGGSVKYEKIADCHVATEITNGQKFFTGISMENCAGKCLANDQCVYFGYGNPAGYKSDAGRISDGQKFGKCALVQSDIQLQDDSICRWSVYDPTSEISTETVERYMHDEFRRRLPSIFTLKQRLED